MIHYGILESYVQMYKERYRSKKKQIEDKIGAKDRSEGVDDGGNRKR
jgi:hypothetical protein